MVFSSWVPDAFPMSARALVGQVANAGHTLGETFLVSDLHLEPVTVFPGDCSSVQISTSWGSAHFRFKVSSLLSRSTLLANPKNYNPRTLSVGHKSGTFGVAEGQLSRGC